MLTWVAAMGVEMISGIHNVVFTSEPEAVRAFFRDVLEFSSVDAGDGWLIFALPPAEVAMHPHMEGVSETKHEMYLMCVDVEATVADLTAKGVECGEIEDQGFGRLTSITIPDGSRLGLYEPRHPTPIDLGR